MGVKRAAEDVGEADDIVYLVGIVGASGGDEHVGTGSLGILVGDFRRRVRQGKDDGILRHAAHHVLRQHVALRQAEEDVCPADCLSQGMHVAAVGGKEALRLVQVLAVGGYHALAVEHEDVLLARTQGDVELRAGDGGRPGAVDHDADVLDALACHLEGVEQSRGGDDGGAVLVVVHHGDVQLLFQPTLDFKALRRLDVLEVDAAEGGCNRLDCRDELLGVLLVDFDVEHVDAGVYLEEQSLALHHRLAAERADVAQTEHRRAVGDDCHEIAFVRIVVRRVGVLLDFETGLGDARRIGERQVGLRTVGFGGNYFNLSGPSL